MCCEYYSDWSDLKRRTSGVIGPFAGSRDETVRVWSLADGRPLTLFDVHAAVCDVMMTSEAGRIVVRLADSCHVPFLCLHNSPAAASTAAVTAAGRRHSPPVIGVAGQSSLGRVNHMICLHALQH